MIKQLLKRREQIVSEIEKCEIEINNAPRGRLQIHRNGNTLRWRLVGDDRKRRNMSKNEITLAKKLARKRISFDYMKLLKKELYAIEFCLNHMPNDSDYIDLNEEKSLYASLLNIPTTKKTPWHQQEYERNKAHPEGLKHQSPSGNILRSKSECLIDMSLFYRGIPFRYESKLVIGTNKFFPDFTFYKEKTGEYKYWEHFGMMDDPQYRKKALAKIDQYIKAGLIPNEEVIFTFETSMTPISVNMIDKMIHSIEEWITL